MKSLQPMPGLTAISFGGKWDLTGSVLAAFETSFNFSAGPSARLGSACHFGIGWLNFMRTMTMLQRRNSEFVLTE